MNREICLESVDRHRYGTNWIFPSNTIEGQIERELYRMRNEKFCFPETTSGEIYASTLDWINSELDHAMQKNNETRKDLVAIKVKNPENDLPPKKAFFAWTNKNIYSARIAYGRIDVISLPRNPFESCEPQYII